MSSVLIVEQRGNRLQVAINRPERRNALSLDLLDRIGEVFTHFSRDESLQCAVLTATGDRCFAAGGDLKELDAIRTEADTLAMSRRARAALDAVRQFPVPVIAALNGHALGGGAELAMACDLRVATHQAELGFLQGQLNVTTAWGGGIDLLALLGPARGLALLLEARRIPAAEALQLGLLQRVSAPHESVSECTDRFIEPLLQRPVHVLRACKALALEHRRALHDRLAAVEERGFTASWVHADHWAAAELALAPGVAAKRSSNGPREA
ncbi:MAG: enoyl-CoA hydratase/isomerase family protein [Gammaproteobacteria bacterium]|nr:enoyl-CoA hydratase/isomerase family protein [Gammaproteobacteria bacterium]